MNDANLARFELKSSGMYSGLHAEVAANTVKQTAV